MSRILFTSSPGLGHVHPMVPLAAALAGRGHDVRWAVAADAGPRLAAAGFATFAAGIDVGPRQAEYHRRYPDAGSLPPDARPDHMFPALFGEISPPPMLIDLLRVAEAWAPTLIVHDASELAAPIAAALLGVPSVTHGFGALVPERRVAVASAAIAPLWRSHGLEPRPYGGSYDHLYLDIYPPSLQEALPAYVGLTQPLRPVPFDAVGEPVAVPSGSRRRVYVTFGTLFNDVSGAFSSAVSGVARLPVDVLVTVGPAGDPAAFGVQPENVRVERYVPQSAVLPGCSAVVSHAGSGTFLASLSLGIPQLCLPQAADQFINARRGAEAGAALVLGPSEVSAGAVTAAVRRLLDDDSFAAAARSVAADIAAMPGPDHVAAVLEALL